MGIKSRLLKFKPNSLEQTFREMAQRFAVPFFCALTLTVVFLCHVRFNNGHDIALNINTKVWWYAGFISLIPSFFITVAASLVFENYAPQKPSWFKNLSNLCVVMALALYTHYMLPFNIHQNIATFVQLGFWCFALVFVAHHDYKNDNLVFWHNTKYILGTVLLAMFLSLVVLIGASCVFGAIDALFGTKIIEPTMFLVGIVVIFLAAPSVVMAQLPSASTIPTTFSIQQASIVTKALVIIQWLLTAVLLAYAAHILIGWQLPKGRVVYQVGSYAVGGMLVYFWAYHAQATKFVANYVRHWPKVLLSLAILPTIAISVRIAAHGITPNRLLVVYLLVAIVGFGIITLWPKLTNKRLPLAALSLLAIAFLAFFSPINAQRVAKHYFGYDSSQAMAERLGHENITSFDIDVVVFKANHLVSVNPYTQMVEVALSNDNKNQTTLKIPHRLQLSLMPLYPQKLYITDLDCQKTWSIALDQLLNNHPLIKENKRPYQYAWATNKEIPAIPFTLGKHQIKIMPYKISGYYNQTKDGDIANYKNIKKIDALQFYLLIK